MPHRSLCLLATLFLAFGLNSAGAPAGEYVKKSTWRETLAANLGSGPTQAVQRVTHDFPDDRLALEVVADWIVQDGLDAGGLRTEIVGKVIEELGPGGAKLRGQYEALVKASAPAADPRWAKLYLAACRQRREARLKPHLEKLRRVVFTKHYDLGGSHYAYTEGQSDAQAERHFTPGATLCLLELDGVDAKVRTLLDDPKGVIRDPDVSYDGRRVLFAWKKSLNEDDYHLYELTAADGQIRQLTHGLGFADYEGAYLPNGDLIFNSTRCVQIVDCWWTEVSNLYTCGPDGQYLRQLSFDQVHTNFPAVTPDGRVIYTRWDYNDRGQIYPQGLFQMNPEGTGQTALYGNNSWFPTTILHARAIPGTGKIVCIFTGHHSLQKGWLGMLDPGKGREENEGAQLIAPVRDTPAVHVDSYGQSGDQFQYPYPLDEENFLVAFRPEKAPRFGIYYVAIDGRRELLVSDPRISCNQPVPLAARPAPPARPNLVNYRKDTGTVYLHDIFRGPGLEGVPREKIKALRVIALDFRAAGIGSNGNGGPAGGAMISTPISIQGAWDVKKVLGTARVNDDGSACFTVPAKTAIYFQALDDKGRMVQSMRSWVSLQPGETASCVGCHEHKNTAPPVTPVSRAMETGPQDLEPFYGPPRGFSFIKEVQPVLDNRCVSCHYLDETPKYATALVTSEIQPYQPDKMKVLVPCKGDATWRYTFKKPGPKWNCACFDDSGWSTGPGGFGTGAPAAVVGTPWTTSDIWLRRTFELPKDYKPNRPLLLLHHDEDAEVFLNEVRVAKVREFVTEYGLRSIPPAAAPRPGPNLLAVHCMNRDGDQYIDVGIVEPKSRTVLAADPSHSNPQGEGVKPAFSLKGTQALDGESQRKWSRSYKALATRHLANWINVQSAPPMLPPYHAGASQSRLIEMLESGEHYGVRLSKPEMDRVIVWIDLLVPYVGDYTEALNEDKLPRYVHFLEKRRNWLSREAENIAAMLEGRQ